MHITYDPLYTIICVVIAYLMVGLTINSIDSNPLLRWLSFTFHSLCFRKDLCSFAFLLLGPTIYEIVTLEEEGSSGSNGLGFLLVVVFIEPVGNPTVRFFKLCMYLLIAKFQAPESCNLFIQKSPFMAYYQEGKLQQFVC
jgi:hypothetical protein